MLDLSPMAETSHNLLGEYVSKDALAAELQCSERTINRMMNEPDGLPHVRLRGRVMFSVASVRRWIAAKETQRNPIRRRAGGAR